MCSSANRTNSSLFTTGFFSYSHYCLYTLCRSATLSDTFYLINWNLLHIWWHLKKHLYSLFPNRVLPPGRQPRSLCRHIISVVPFPSCCCMSRIPVWHLQADKLWACKSWAATRQSWTRKWMLTFRSCCSFPSLSPALLSGHEPPEVSFTDTLSFGWLLILITWCFGRSVSLPDRENCFKVCAEVVHWSPDTFNFESKTKS